MSLKLFNKSSDIETGSMVSLEEHQRAISSLDVSGYPDPLGPKRPFGKNDAIFKFDSWDMMQGLNYLVGIESWHTNFDTGFTEVRTLDHERFCTPNDDLVISYFIENLSKIRAVWDSGKHNSINPPIYYINWAKSKEIEIPWLSYVESEELISTVVIDQTEGGLMKSENLASTIYSDKPLNPRLENNYLRLIYSLCFSLKGFDPTARPHTIAKLVIDVTGIDISQETLAGYIEKAKALENQERE
jgi:hypothetical protein